MITRLTVSNFRSIAEHVIIQLDQLTVFVGTNGSGKSNVLDALRFLSDAVHLGLQGAVTHRNGIAGVRRWSGGRPFDTEIEVDVGLGDGRRGTYGFVLSGSKGDEYVVKREMAEVWDATGAKIKFKAENGAVIEAPAGLSPSIDAQTLALPLIAGDARFSALARVLRDVVVYAIFPDTLRQPQRYNPVRPMTRHGENWVSVLKDSENAAWRGELVAALAKLTGDVEDVRVARAADYLVAEFKHATAKTKHKWFPGSQESDGTLRVAGIVTALLQEPAVPVIGVEEPELTVHPGAIPLLFDFLNEATGRSQVLVTTHSPELLDLVPPEAVRVVRGGENGTTVLPMDPLQVGLVKDGLMTLGEVQRTHGLQQQLGLFDERTK